jgi:hypothetical protein
MGMGCSRVVERVSWAANIGTDTSEIAGKNVFCQPEDSVYLLAIGFLFTDNVHRKLASVRI